MQRSDTSYDNNLIKRSPNIVVNAIDQGKAEEIVPGGTVDALSQPELNNSIARSNLSISLLLKTIAALPSDQKPLIPFMLMYYVALFNLDVFVRAAGELFNSNDNSEKVATSSCLNTALATSIIFFGKDLTKKISARLRRETTTTLSVSLPSGNSWKYKIKNVFDGGILREIEKNEAFTTNTNQVSNEKIMTYINPYVNSFFKYTQPLVDNCLKDKNCNDDNLIAKLKNCFSKLDYPFNASTITALKNNIEDNIKNIGLDKTAVYFICIVTPDDIDAKQFLYEHVFLIEQFFLKEQNEVRYRIYQSWINKATLLDDFKKHRYGELGENSWRNEELYDFLNKFETLFCKSTNLNYAALSEKCFGYFNKAASLSTFNGKKLSGLSVRYLSALVNPEKCLDNFIDFITSNPRLKNNM